MTRLAYWEDKSPQPQWGVHITSSNHYGVTNMGGHITPATYWEDKSPQTLWGVHITSSSHYGVTTIGGTHHPSHILGRQINSATLGGTHHFI